MAKTRTFKAGDKIHLKDKHSGDVETYTVVKSEFKYNASRGDDATHITIKDADGKTHSMTLDDIMDELVESKKTARPKFQKFIKEEGDAYVVFALFYDMADDLQRTKLGYLWVRRVVAAIDALQHSSTPSTGPMVTCLRNIKNVLVDLNTADSKTTADKIRLARTFYKNYEALMQIAAMNESVVVKEGFDDDEDDLPTKVVTIPDAKLKAIQALMKVMNPQKRGYAERLLDWIQSGAKAGNRPSAISFGLGGFSASSVEGAFKSVELWPKGVKI